MDMNIEELLRIASEQAASDLHLTVGVPPVLRINAELVPLEAGRLAPSDTEAFARAVLDDRHWEQFAASGEVDASYSLPGISRYRVNVYRQRGCAAIAVRVIPKRIPDVGELNLPAVLTEMMMRTSGLIIINGPAGTGKSTSAAALIDYVNRSQKRNIITLEDPIEYLHGHQMSLIDQREIGLDTFSFASGLRSALRQDPDIVFVGDLRDMETMAVALTAAETGHLVLGTLRTTDASQTIDRIIDIFPPAQQQQARVQLAAALAGVVSQRLLPTADNQGRAAAFEVLVNNPAVANLIRSDKVPQIRSVLETGRAQGMQAMEASVMDLVRDGTVTMEAVRKYAAELVNGH
ncbi:MAG: type IV pilus twitching motility protein PilT [Peptococcaceae bacterium]|jgi:twitching motility protein PilT|nr:type IV pilus twitching motility protein PilT [Peptococcaceae bacterium]